MDQGGVRGSDYTVGIKNPGKAGNRIILRCWAPSHTLDRVGVICLYPLKDENGLADWTTEDTQVVDICIRLLPEEEGLKLRALEGS